MQVVDQLRKSEQRFQDFAEVSSDWFWETDADLRSSWMSDRMQAVTGVAPEEHRGRTRQEIGAPGADPQAYAQLLEDLNAHRPFRDFVHTRQKPDGTTVHVAISGKPTFDADGRFLGYKGTGRDIGEQKRIEQELIRSRDRADRANQAKSEFIASMSHELRTPLNAIIGMCETLLVVDAMRDNQEKVVEYLGDIKASGEHLKSLIDDVLDLAKIDAGIRHLGPEMIDAVAIAEDVVRLMSEVARRDGSSIALTAPASVDLVYADRPRAFGRC